MRKVRIQLLAEMIGRAWFDPGRSGARSVSLIRKNPAMGDSEPLARRALTAPEWRGPHVASRRHMSMIGTWAEIGCVRKNLLPRHRIEKGN